MKDSNKKPSRRQFLETGITGVAGITLGLAAGEILELGAEDKPEMVRMLTADGMLVEVDKRHLTPMCGKPPAVSNKELLDWMQNGKH